MTIRFDNSYRALPPRFFEPVAPSSVRAPRLIRLNESLAGELGLDPDWLRSAEGIETLAGNHVPVDAEPIATAYAGHQFGHFVPQLGDGRAILLGEVVRPQGGRRDIQLKGAGPTPYSRRGDGRAALGPVLREYILSEAMAALGVPTTRALAAVSTGEMVRRDVALPGAVLTRVASSHIRIGTFQFFASRGDVDGVRTLADHVIARHYETAASLPNPYLALLEGVVAAQAVLMARWMLIGFIHGVMNTDNMSVCGETIDYGPCAFLDAYDPAKVFSSIDESGRYAFGNQPLVARWNLARLAEALLPLIADTETSAIAQAKETLANFDPRFDEAYLAGMRAKLGLDMPRQEDPGLIQDLLRTMHEGQADFTLTFRHLGAASGENGDVAAVRGLFADPQAFDAWHARFQHRLGHETRSDRERREAMRQVNPLFIPRNHRIENLIEAAVERDDFGPFSELLAVLATPYEDQPGMIHYAAPPKAGECVLQTFCGT